MNTRRHNLPSILAAGVVTTVLVLTGLFWARFFCSVQRHHRVFQAAPNVQAPLTELLSWERPDDPNLVSPYLVMARPHPVLPLITGLGVVQYLLARVPTGPESCVYRWDSDPDGDRLYYDRTLGQIVYRGTQKTTRADGDVTLAPFVYYAGPEGVARAPDEKLGRFTDPVVDRFRMRPLIVYDPHLARFLRIDWTNLEVTKGPELPPDGRHVPVQIGTLEKNPQSLEVIYHPQSRRDPAVRPIGDPGTDDRKVPAVFIGLMSMSQRETVLDASGWIDLLDTDSLELTRSQIRLEAPAGLYSRGRAAMPRDVAAYSVQPVSVHFPGPDRGTWATAGCAVASLSRDATSVRLDVFDPNGRIVVSEQTEVPQYTETHDGRIAHKTPIASPEAAYFRLPGANGLTLTQFALESLHPPVFLLLSYFPASKLEATAGQRSLLLLPDSFLAMKARDKQGRPIEEFCASMACAIPALLLALVLARRVDRDGRRLGLSKNARTAWIVGTVLFGLPAYLTYRLTRPRATLVTCANCGLGRRPDDEKCHHCGSPWTVPELTPPAWRVIAEPEPAEEYALSPEPQADSQVQ